MNPSPKLLRPTFAIEKQFDYSIFIATLCQDLFGSADYASVPEKYKVNFAGAKFVDKDGETKYVHGKLNRWVRSTRRTKKDPYKPSDKIIAMYTMELDHPLLMDRMGARVSTYKDEKGDNYTACMIGMTYWSNLARAWTYDGHHMDYAKREIERIIECAIAYQWERRDRMRCTRKFL